MELVRSCCQPKQLSLLRSIFRTLLSEWIYDIGTKPHYPTWMLCRATDLNRQPVQEKEICSYLNLTALLLQMAKRKSLEMMSGMSLNGSVVNASQCESGNTDLIPAGCWNSLPRVGHRGTEPVSALTQCHDSDTRAFILLHSLPKKKIVSGDLALTGF